MFATLFVALTAWPAGGASERPIVATVGGLPIYEWEVIQAINSTPMQAFAGQLHTTDVGVKVKQGFLDNLINGRLLYLEAKAQGLDKTGEFVTQLAAWETQALADLYSRAVVNREPKITEEEIVAAWEAEKNTGRGTNPLDPQMREVVRNKLAARRFQEVQAELRASLETKVTVEAQDQDLKPSGDAERDPDRVIATIVGEKITWQRARPRLQYKKSVGQRRAALAALGEDLLKEREARRLGLHQDPGFRQRREDFVRDLTAGQLRRRLRAEHTPTDEEFAAYYRDHIDEFILPEKRRVQQIVVKSAAEARDLRKRILEETREDYDPFYRLAQDFSVDPEAGRNAGVLGWITRGRPQGLPELEQPLFTLAVGEVSQPIQTPYGWHLVRALEAVAAHTPTLEEINTGNLRQRYNERLLKRALTSYFAELRHRYRVVVDRDWIGRIDLPGSAPRDEGRQPTVPNER